MTEENLNNILHDILELSKIKKVRWSQTSTSAQYMATIGNAEVIIDEYNTGTTSKYYILNICNDEGSSIYTYSTKIENNSKISDLIEKIYSTAENVFYRKDETMQSLRDTLSVLKEESSK